MNFDTVIYRIYVWICPMCGFIHESEYKPQRPLHCHICNDGNAKTYKQSKDVK